MAGEEYPSPLAGEGGDPRSGEGEGAAAGIPLTSPLLRNGSLPLPRRGEGVKGRWP